MLCHTHLLQVAEDVHMFLAFHSQASKSLGVQAKHTPEKDCSTSKILKDQTPEGSNEQWWGQLPSY
eukprot:3140696-Amphidinium_carterae.1